MVNPVVQRLMEGEKKKRELQSFKKAPESNINFTEIDGIGGKYNKKLQAAFGELNIKNHEAAERFIINNRLKEEHIKHKGIYDSLKNHYADYTPEKKRAALQSRLTQKYEKDASNKFVRKKPAQVIPGITKLSEKEVRKGDKINIKKGIDAKSLKNIFGGKATLGGLKNAGQVGWKGIKGAGKTAIAAGGLAIATGKKVKKGASAVTKEIIHPSGFWIFIIAILVYFLDLLLIEIGSPHAFVGVDIEIFISRFTNLMPNLWRFASNFVVLMAIVSYYFFKYFPRAPDTEFLVGSFTIFFFYFIFSIGRGNIGAIIHIVLALLFFAFVLLPNNPDNAIKAYKWSIGLVAIDFFLFSAIGYFTHSIDLSYKFVFPIWPIVTGIYSFRYLHYEQKFARKFVAACLIVLFIVPVSMFVQTLPSEAKELSTALQSQTPLTNFKNSAKGAFNKGKKSIQDLISGTKKKTDEALAYATGDYYTGKVDRNVEEPLGVYITDIETLSPDVYEDEEIELWATLIAKSDVDEPIDLIKVQCTADAKEPEPISGKSTRTEFREFIDEEEDLDCKFEAAELETGSHLITFTANFTFTTLAYLKTYFIDNSRLKAFRRENIDVFQEYGITDKNPISIYTNGPVGIGMETKTPPIGISEEFYSNPKLGITIENKWLGKIERINDLIIYLPKGIELEDNCDEAFEPLSTNDYDDISLEDYNAYRLVDLYKDDDIWQNIESYRSKNCRLSIKEGDVRTILGDTPISIKYIKARIEYNYNSEESVGINIQTPKGFNVYFDPKKPSLADFDEKGKYVDCVASHSDLYVIRAPFTIYLNDAEKYKEDVECESKSYKCKYHIEKIEGLKRGDELKCKVLKAELSNEVEETDTAIVTIQNSPPTIKELKFEQENPTINDELKCIAQIEDIDGDVWAVTYYEIKKNGIKLKPSELEWEENDNQFIITIKPKDGLKENDRFSCEIKAIDLPEDTKFERMESELSSKVVTISKPPETTTTGTTGGSGTSTSSNLNADCNLKENHIRACGGSTKRNCFFDEEKQQGGCLTECELHARLGDSKYIKENYVCVCDLGSDYDPEKCFPEGCPDPTCYCCDPSVGGTVMT